MRKDSGWTTNKNNITICKSCFRNRGTKPIDCSQIKHLEAYKRVLMLSNIRRKANTSHFNLLAKITREKSRIETLLHYGGKCSCCGYDDLNKKIFGRSFLQLHHIEGRKNHSFTKHDNSGSHSFHTKLKKLGYPKGLRVLCRPCNNGMDYNESVCELHKWESSK